MRVIYVMLIVLAVFLSQLEAVEMMDFVRKTDIKYQNCAVIENQNGTLVLHGGRWTNAQDKGFGYDGNGVASIKGYDFIGSYVGIKFSVDAGGRYSSFRLYPEGFKEVMSYTIHNTWANSKLIKEAEILYQTLYISSDGSWVMSLSKDGYDREILYEKRGKLSKSEKKRLEDARLVFLFSDNKAGRETKLYVYEVELEKQNQTKEKP